MALALALSAQKETENGDYLLLITILYSLVSVLGIGSILGPLFTKLKLRKITDSTNEESTYQSVF